MIMTGYSYQRLTEAAARSSDDEEDVRGGDGPWAQPRSRLAKIEGSWLFKAVAMAMILLNVLAMAWEADDPKLGIADLSDSIFLGWFVIELAVKIVAHGADFFCHEEEGRWNMFDFVIVLTGVLEEWVLGPMLRDESAGAVHEQKYGLMLMFMRALRLLRISRALRLLHSFKELYLLVLGLGQSFTSVFWIMVMFMMTLVSFAIFLTTIVGHEPELYEDPAYIVEKFGTMGRTMVTLFIFCTCDDWSTPARMVNKVYWWMFFVWLLYMLIANFTLFSMLTGLMADKMKAARGDQEEAEREDEAARYRRLLAGLRKVFEEGDASGDCLLDKEEFEEILSRADVLEDLGTCGVNVAAHGLDDLWKCLDVDMDGRLTWGEFSKGLFQLTNEVSAKDIMWLEGSVMKLDACLKEAGIGEPQFDSRLDGLHSRASLMQQRLFQMEGELEEIFDIVGYRAVRVSSILRAVSSPTKTVRPGRPCC